jgi:hypothetical protein
MDKKDKEPKGTAATASKMAVNKKQTGVAVDANRNAVHR